MFWRTNGSSGKRFTMHGRGIDADSTRLLKAQDSNRGAPADNAIFEKALEQAYYREVVDTLEFPKRVLEEMRKRGWLRHMHDIGGTTETGTKRSEYMIT